MGCLCGGGRGINTTYLKPQSVSDYSLFILFTLIASYLSTLYPLIYLPFRVTNCLSNLCVLHNIFLTLAYCIVNGGVFTLLSET